MRRHNFESSAVVFKNYFWFYRFRWSIDFSIATSLFRVTTTGNGVVTQNCFNALGDTAVSMCVIVYPVHSYSDQFQFLWRMYSKFFGNWIYVPFASNICLALRADVFLFPVARESRLVGECSAVFFEYPIVVG